MTDTGIFTYIGIALVAVLTAVFLKESKLNSLALLAALAGGTIILIKLAPSLSTLFQGYEALGSMGGANEYYFRLLLKIIGVAYICEFAAQVCRDASQGAAALKLELAGKVAILILSLPVLSSIVQTVWGLL